MKKVLFINGNPQKEDQSYSRKVGKYYLDQLSKDSEDTQVEMVHVYEDHVPLIDSDVLEAWGALRGGKDFGDLSEEQQMKVGQMGKILNQFKMADEYVFVSPMWNFSMPPMLKAYIDNVMIAGETFKYTENGPVGLLEDKKALIIQASGGVYSEGPGAELEHGSNLMATVLGFMGVKAIEKILVEGVAMPNKTEEEKISKALEQVDKIFN